MEWETKKTDTSGDEKDIHAEPISTASQVTSLPLKPKSHDHLWKGEEIKQKQKTKQNKTDKKKTNKQNTPMQLISNE